EANPSSRWLAPLLERSKDLPATVYFGPWISQRLNDRDMIDAVVEKRAALTTEACRQIEWTILKDPSVLSSTRRDFWLALIDTAPSDQFGRGEQQHYKVRRLLSTVRDTGYFTRTAVADMFRPEL